MYGNVTDADTYHAARGNATWTGTDPAKTVALVRASDYIDGRYRYKMSSGRWQSQFLGAKAGGRAQIPEWPRTDATDYEGEEIADDVVPVEVEYATYEAALRELVTPGSLSPDYTPGTQIESAEVHEAVKVTYSKSSQTDNSTPNRPVIPMIDEIIAPLLRRPYELPAVLVV